MSLETEKAPARTGTLTAYQTHLADQEHTEHDTSGIEAVFAHAREYGAMIAAALGGVR